jgi:hypothetical protein
MRQIHAEIFYGYNAAIIPAFRLSSFIAGVSLVKIWSGDSTPIRIVLWADPTSMSLGFKLRSRKLHLVFRCWALLTHVVNDRVAEFRAL